MEELDAGGAVAGDACRSHRLIRETLDGADVPSGLIEIKHFGAETSSGECDGERREAVWDVAIAMWQARISDALSRQHAIFAQRT